MELSRGKSLENKNKAQQKFSLSIQLQFHILYYHNATSLQKSQLSEIENNSLSNQTENSVNCSEISFCVSTQTTEQCETASCFLSIGGLRGTLTCGIIMWNFGFPHPGTHLGFILFFLWFLFLFRSPWLRNNYGFLSNTFHEIIWKWNHSSLTSRCYK